MEYIRVTKDNLESEHICCAISNNRDIQVASKKAWLAERFDDGLVFLKSVERGKCFIEYIPAENAWHPLDADGYLHIDCLKVIYFVEYFFVLNTKKYSNTISFYG